MECYFTTWNKVCDVVVGNIQQIWVFSIKKKVTKFWVSKVIVIVDHDFGMF